MSAAAEYSWSTHDLETELRLLFENAPLGLAQCQEQGNITALNPVLEQMLVDRSDVGRSHCLSDLIHPDDRPASQRLLQEMFEGRRQSFQFTSRSPRSSHRPISWTAWRVSGRDGNPDYALATAFSPDEDHESAQRLRQAQRLEAVGRLASGVAHDFNNILTGVLLYCDLLMAGLEPGHRAHKYAEEIRKAGVQASGLVRQLLAVSRPSNSEPRMLSLNEVAESMRNLLIRLIGENIKLELRLDPSLGLIKLDPTQAQQILLNLVLNSRDAMPGGGQIIIQTRTCTVQVLGEAGGSTTGEPSLPCVLLAVEDNGSGMDAATREHLFEPFFTTKGGKGTGLGLATVHDIVRTNGGLIHIDSAPGRGTRVSVLLPVVSEINSQVTSMTPPEPRDGVIHQEKGIIE